MTSTISNSFRERCIQARFVPSRLRRDEEGQTAAEYMGILLLVATIIFALVVTVDLDKVIADSAKALVESIAGGGKAGPEAP